MGDLVWAVVLVAFAQLPLVLFTSDRFIVHVWGHHQDAWRRAGSPTCYFSRGMATPGDPRQKGPRESAVRNWIWSTPPELRECKRCRWLRLQSGLARTLMFVLFVAAGSLALFANF